VLQRNLGSVLIESKSSLIVPEDTRMNLIETYIDREATCGEDLLRSPIFEAVQGLQVDHRT